LVVRGVQPSRGDDCAEVRGHRPRPRDLAQARAHDGRRRDGGERARQGLGVHRARAGRRGRMISDGSAMGRPVYLQQRTYLVAARTAVECRLCCKSLFAPLIKNFQGCRRGFRVNMWGASSHDDELTGKLANELDAISIDDRSFSRKNRHETIWDFCNTIPLIAEKHR
jgi:hypothetical protein